MTKANTDLSELMAKHNQGDFSSHYGRVGSTTDHGIRALRIGPHSQHHHESRLIIPSRPFGKLYRLDGRELCSSLSGTSRPQKPKQTSARLWKLNPWQRNSPKSVSDKPGAVRSQMS